MWNTVKKTIVKSDWEIQWIVKWTCNYTHDVKFIVSIHLIHLHGNQIKFHIFFQTLSSLQLLPNIYNYGQLKDIVYNQEFRLNSWTVLLKAWNNPMPTEWQFVRHPTRSIKDFIYIYIYTYIDIKNLKIYNACTLFLRLLSPPPLKWGWLFCVSCYCKLT